MSSETKHGPRLVVIEGKEKGKVIPLTEGVVIIGRSKGDVVIPDARISRSHVSLHFDAKSGRLTFEDLKSLNGTQLNGETATSGDLKDGDRLQVGNTVLDCQLGLAATSNPELPQTPPKRISKETATPKVAPPQAFNVDSFADALRKEPQMPSGTWVEPSEIDTPQPMAAAETEEAPRKKGNLFSRFRKTTGPIRGPSRTIRNSCAALIVLLVLYAYLGKEKTNFEKPKLPDKNLFIGEGNLDIDSEIKRLQSAAEAQPENSENLVQLGKLYSKQGRFEEALAVLRKARAMPNVTPLVHVRLIQAFLRTGLSQEVEGELNALDKAIREGRHSKELFVEAASLYLEFREIKQPPEKTLILAKALQTEFAPGDPVGYKLEIQALLQQNRNEDALAVLEKGLALAPNDEWFLENQAFLYLSQKDVAKAIVAVESWLSYYPKASKPLLVMGYLRFNQKEFDKVTPYLQRVIDSAKENSRDPFLAEALSLMGQVFEQTGRSDEAGRYFSSACESGFQAACTRLSSAQPATPAAANAGSVTGTKTPDTSGAQSPAASNDAVRETAKSPTQNTDWPGRTPNSVVQPKKK